MAGKEITTSNKESHKEILNKINNGTYRVVEKSGAKSSVWKVFRVIYNEDGYQLQNIVFCRICRRVLNYHRGKTTSNLIRHKCRLLHTNEGLNEDKGNILDVCTRWIIEDSKSCSSLESAAFKKMVKAFIKIGAKYGSKVNIDNLLPSALTISSNVNNIEERKEPEADNSVERPNTIPEDNDIKPIFDGFDDMEIEHENYIESSEEFEDISEITQPAESESTTQLTTKNVEDKNFIKDSTVENKTDTEPTKILISSVDSEIICSMKMTIPAEEDAICNYLCTELKRFKLEETFDKFRVELFGLIGKLKAQERHMLNKMKEESANLVKRVVKDFNI